jgi:hypothetical protein
MLQSIVDVLVLRDGMTRAEAEKQVQEARADFQAVINSGDIYAADDFLADTFGLEDDYLEELIEGI